MAEPTGRVVIAGAGQAGGWVAATIREIQPEREIVLVGAEPYPPYERPPLSKAVLTGNEAPESTYLKPLDYYEAKRIGLRLETTVDAIDCSARAVSLSDGETLTYDTLVIATGLSPRTLTVPGADHPKVVTLRTLADLDAVRAGLGPGRRMVAVGAGFIGLEVAAAAIGAGSQVTVVEAMADALGRVVAPDVAASIVARHARAGVTFRFDAKVERIADRDGRPELTLTTGERMAADLVLVGIGAVPNDALARSAGLACDNGIVVDEKGLTSDPHIYAVGDVCNQLLLALQRRVRLESWQNAQNQAIAAGSRIAGAPKPYADLPWFWTDQYDDNLQLVGVPETWDRIVWRGARDEDRFTAIYMKDGRVVGGNALNNPRDIRALKQFILDGVVIAPDILADTSTTLVKIQKMQAAQ